jgi:hypothetical protein
MKNVKWALIGAMSVILLGAVVIFVLYFQNNDKFFSGTMINSIDCTSKTVTQVEKELLSNIEEQKLTVTGRGGLEEEFSGEDLGVSYSFGNQLEEALSDSQSITNLFQSKEYTVDYTLNIDEKVLKNKMKKLLDSQTIVESEDAKVVYNKKQGKYEIQEEVYGNYFDIENAAELVKQALEDGDESVDLESCYLDAPTVLSDDEELTEKVEELNKYMITITLDFSDRKEVITSAMIQSWMQVAEDGTITYDETAMRSYLQEISKTYDTYGKERKFKTSKGKTIKVSGGSYGWMIHNGDTIKKIEEAIESGEDTVMEPAYSFQGYVRDKDDIGDSYIEISLKDQHVWVYIDGEEKVSTDCVTGNASKGYDTPTGIYPINYLKRDATLTGEGYSSPVSYWMPFNGNVGLHDASWRSSFGGTIYKTSGSHGCVNLPPSAAKKIFEIIEPGMPVIVYDK